MKCIFFYYIYPQLLHLYPTINIFPLVSNEQADYAFDVKQKKKKNYYWLKHELTLTHVFCGHVVHTVCYLFILSPTSQTGATF